MHSQLRALIRKCSPAKISAMSTNPLAVIMPLLDLYIAESGSRLKEDLNGLDGLIEKFSLTRGRLEDYRFETGVYSFAFRTHSRSYSNSLRSMKAAYALLGETPHRAELETQILDLEDILEHTHKGQRQLERFMADWSTERSLQDSHKSVQYADSVGRVTVLAFFFIPLSFVTSLFGMNLQAFGSGSLRAQVVIGVTIGVVMLTSSIWFMSHWFTNRLRKLLERFEGFWRFRRYWLAMARVSPIRAFWMFAFMLAHGPDYYELFIKYLGFDNLNNPDGPWVPPRYEREITILEENITPFWNRKARLILVVTKRPGWFKRQHGNPDRRSTA